MPRAADARASDDKWRGWILAAHGHGEDWARVFGVGPHETQRIWGTIVGGCRCAGLGRA